MYHTVTSTSHYQVCFFLCFFFYHGAYDYKAFLIFLFNSLKKSFLFFEEFHNSDSNLQLDSALHYSNNLMSIGWQGNFKTIFKNVMQSKEAFHVCPSCHIARIKPALSFLIHDGWNRMKWILFSQSCKEEGRKTHVVLDI